MEAYAIAQMEDERFGIGLVPAFSKGRREMKAAVARDQAVKEELVDMLRLSVSAYARIEIGGAGVDEEDDRAGIALKAAATQSAATLMR